MDRTVDYRDGTVFLIDQNRIPAELVRLELTSPEQVADAIKTMRVRGAPAIGVAAALGVALAARRSQETDPRRLLDAVETAARLLRDTRPTAVNLFWGIERMLREARECASRGLDAHSIRDSLDRLALEIIEEDENVCRQIGRHGAGLLPAQANLLTHCNAGALACVSYGTALGVVRAAVEMGKQIRVYADETRPRLQGMKLTCYELAADGIPVTVITDSMAGALMRKGLIDCVVVGADRVAANGDAANKIGTYSVAVLANFHSIPFYVAAPLSTVDFSLESGDAIPIEERSQDEVLTFNGHRVAPEGVEAMNPAFDVTPAELVTAIITEKGIARPPYKQNLRQLADI